MSIINTYNFFLSSAKRTGGTSDSFQTSLFRPIALSSPNNWFSVRVGSVEIPYVFKLINESNYTVNFTLIRNSITYNSSVVLTPGNYNILTLLTELKTRLATAISTLSGWNPTTVLSFTYDRSSGFATFAINGIDSVSTTLTISDNQPVFLKCVGFTTPFSFGYTSPIARTLATSTQNVNVSQNTALYIRSESFVQSSNIENVVVDNEPSNILAKIQVNAAPQSYILWTNPTDLEVKVNNRVIDIISLYVGTSTSYTANLGNLDWSLRLTVHEWSEHQVVPDYAVNMTPTTLPPDGLQNLLDEREKAVSKLRKIRGKLSSVIPNDPEAETNPER
jgi:hypothetical protein